MIYLVLYLFSLVFLSGAYVLDFVGWHNPGSRILYENA